MHGGKIALFDERQRLLDEELAKPTSDPLTTKPVKDGTDEKKGRASDAYRKAFWNAMRSKAPSYEIHNALEEGADSEGGYLVPDEFEHTLVMALEEENIFRKLAKVIRTSSGDRKIPVVTTHGSASWLDEEELYPESDDASGDLRIGGVSGHDLLEYSGRFGNRKVVAVHDFSYSLLDTGHGYSRSAVSCSGHIQI